MPRLADVLRAFDLPGRFLFAERWGSGHINESYRAGTDAGEEVLLQRVNGRVFPDPEGVTENIRRVTDHLRAKVAESGRADPDRRVLRLVPLRGGGHCHRDASGGVWRVFRFIAGARTFDVVGSPKLARESALAYGRFQRDLEDLPGARLLETIEGFHDTPRRLAALRVAADVDATGRLEGAHAEVEFAFSREATAGILVDAHRAGAMPERVIHGDTKLNNVLVDDATGEGICVIDLDTVMPGLSLYDFGGLVRTSVAAAAEDDPDPEHARARPEYFEALVDGYLSGVGDLLTPAERELLPAAGMVHTFEDGVRFLTDHLAGDVYYRISRPGQNLDRARAQFALLRSLEEQEQVFARISR